MQLADEIQWVQASAAGDRDSFARLVERYQGAVTGVAYAVLGDFDRSEDAGQEAFLEGWRRMSTLADPAKFAPWICTIARRRAVDMVRRQKPTGSLAVEGQPIDEQADVSEQAATAEEKVIVWQTLDGLPEKYREAMVLFYRSEQSVREVADSLGENEATIRQRLKRGRDLLRSEISETVERTLRGTSPNHAFVLAVLGSLPGAAKVTGAVTATAGSATSGKALLAAAGTAKAGALLGVLGGVGGGLLGFGMSWRNAKFQSQRDLMVRSTAIFLVIIAAFLLAFFALVKGYFGISLDSQAYGVALAILIIGFQLVIAVWALWQMFAWKKVTRESTEQGDAVLPLALAAEAQMQTMQDRCWTSKARFLGAPLVDIQIWSDASIKKMGSVPKSASGWIAVGTRAYGRFIAIGKLFAIAPISLGQFSIGIVSLGLISFGLFSIGTVAIGGITLGALAIGVTGFGGGAIGGYVLGGLAIGYCAFGGLAMGWLSAKGGLAWSQMYAEGGQAYGLHANDAAAKAFFEQHWFGQLTKPMETGGFPTWLVVTFWIGIGIVVVAQLAFRKWRLNLIR